MLTYKYKRPTDKDEGHTDVFNDGVYIGYMIQDRNWSRAIGKNWYFEAVNGITLVASNRKQLIKYIEDGYAVGEET